MMGGQPIAPFKWNARRWKVAYALAEGKTVAQAAREAGYSPHTVEAWRYKCPDFVHAVDELTLTVGLATKAERARLIMRAIEQSVIDEVGIKTDRDVLDWIKELRLTVDGEELDVTTDGEKLSSNIIVVRETIDDK